MKALLICLSAIILQAGSCNNDGDTNTNCPPCPECPPTGQPDDGSELAEMPHGRAMIDQYKSGGATKYKTVSQMVMNVDDLQTLINMAKRQGRNSVHVFIGSFTNESAREYLTATNENVDQYLDDVTGRPVVLMGTGPDRVYGVRTKICPPPNTCGMDWDKW